MRTKYKKLNFSKKTISGVWKYSVWVADDHILEHHIPKWNGVYKPCYCRFNKRLGCDSVYDENGELCYDKVEPYACGIYRTITDAINNVPYDMSKE